MVAPIRVLLAEGNPAISQALARLLRQAETIDVVAVTSHSSEVLDLLAALHPTVAVISVALRPLDNGALIPSLRARYPGVRVVALGIYPALRDEVLANGACQFLLLDTPPAELVASIQLAAAGNCQVRDSAS